MDRASSSLWHIYENTLSVTLFCSAAEAAYTLEREIRDGQIGAIGDGKQREVAVRNDHQTKALG
jgi:hypothetical protein